MQLKYGKYKRADENTEVEDVLIKQFESKYPNKSGNDLKIEIEKISDMLLDNEESNRYTAKLQRRARKDYRLDKIRKTIPDSVNLLEFKDNDLKAQVNYIDQDSEYTIIMYMKLVAKGRVYLKNYKTMKRTVREGL